MYLAEYRGLDWPNGDELNLYSKATALQSCMCFFGHLEIQINNLFLSHNCLTKTPIEIVTYRPTDEATFSQYNIDSGGDHFFIKNPTKIANFKMQQLLNTAEFPNSVKSLCTLS